MSSIDVDKVMEALSHVNDPELHRDLVSLNMVKDVRVDGSDVALTVELTTPACPMKSEIKNRVETALTEAGASAVDLSWDARVPQARGSSERTTIEGIKNIIAVASGKGGVGKSTTAVNLTLALAQTGAKMGLLDADVYGPSIPTLMKLEHAPQVKSQDDKIIPIESYGVKTISMGFLTTKDTPVIWRGPMIHKIMQEFIRKEAHRGYQEHYRRGQWKGRGWQVHDGGEPHLGPGPNGGEDGSARRRRLRPQHPDADEARTRTAGKKPGR